MRSAGRKDLYLTIQNARKTDSHAPGGIPARSPSQRAAADPHLRPLGSAL